MEFNPHYFQHIKLGVHIAQLVFIFVAWVIEIAVFRSSAKIDGRPGWFFGLVCAVHFSRAIILISSDNARRALHGRWHNWALANSRDSQCFLTIPAVIYETMTPRFPRTRKFAHPYGLVAVDAIFMIMWLSAFAAVASFNSSGKCGSGCKLSEATVGLGVFVWYVFLSSSRPTLWLISHPYR